MTYFLAITHTYEAVDIALCKEYAVISVATISKFDASRDLIPQIDVLLREASLQLSDLSFITANEGPGPFSTLRTVITTVNGIGFATKIPLIGVSGLDAFLEEHADSEYEQSTVVLLNAFSFDVYYAVQEDVGCMNIDRLLAVLHMKLYGYHIRFLGQGAVLYKDKIQQIFGESAYFPDEMPLAVSVQQIAKSGLQIWQQHGEGLYQLVPLYLKQFMPVV
ncbi:MAG TPA: tRNA (adenosine(37)-N6)-threonylcarbamoyltransferase complex dimerization subunit type 1 TsaB [Candidatus Babeliales bacterium]|nr:tRNA (adenosine(37)-N6)-threonylcarbamoyltransferase complex dimerization subunit type 1 TsaB [Candidatus Babeliales bacterium]